MRRAFGPTRAVSPRQLPTDHDYAVATREYQSDQPSIPLTRSLPVLHSQPDNQEEDGYLWVSRTSWLDTVVPYQSPGTWWKFD
jgi:hypothetical protein